MMTAKERSELARGAAKARWSGSRPLSKKAREKLLREVERMTPEENERQTAEFMKRFSGFLNLYKDRPMA